MRDFILLWACIVTLLIYVTTLNVKLQTLRNVNGVLHFHNFSFLYFILQFHVPASMYLLEAIVVSLFIWFFSAIRLRLPKASSFFNSVYAPRFVLFTIKDRFFYSVQILFLTSYLADRVFILSIYNELRFERSLDGNGRWNVAKINVNWC